MRVVCVSPTVNIRFLKLHERCIRRYTEDAGQRGYCANKQTGIGWWTR